MAASRLVYAVARDGVLPLSGWIGQIDAQGQPKNAVTVIYVFAATILCTILPSQVAFTSLVSAGGVPTIAAYGLIALLRLTCTPDNFKSSYFYLGRLAKPFYVSAVIFNALIVAVCVFFRIVCDVLGLMLTLSVTVIGHVVAILLPCFRGDLQFRGLPSHLRAFSFLTRSYFQACVIFGSITVFGVLTWYFTPAEKWLRREHILQAMLATEGEPTGAH